MKRSRILAALVGLLALMGGAPIWAEDGVTMDGKYFKLDDCQSWPKPVQTQPPIVCATTSERLRIQRSYMMRAQT